MLPVEFLTRQQQLLGENYPAFLAAYDRPKAPGLRWNPLKTRDFPALPWSLEPVPWEPLGCYYDPAARPGLHPWHAAGLYYLQEPSAMAPVALLDPQPGERILDLCAAPGGKTTQIAGRMEGRGLLVCNELNPKRARILSSNLERLGVRNALCLNEHPARLADRFPGCFDAVLVDAPCSGEGMFRKEEAAVTDWSPETVSMCAGRQLEILRSAAKVVAPGGRLVYSTCTFSPEENEGVLTAFLKEFPDFSCVEAALPGTDPGRPDWVPDGDPSLRNALRLWPHRLRGEGHFAALLRRSGSGREDWKPLSPSPLPREFSDFAGEALTEVPQGLPLRFGDALYLAPTETPALEGLRVLRPGLELGTVQKGRFLPAHALALALSGAARTLDLEPEDPALAAYLRGQTLPGREPGWTLVLAGGLSIGWGKTAGGTMKNHYPKALRRP